MKMCQCKSCNCTAPATTVLEAMAHGCLYAEADLCAPCRTAFLEGWERMKCDERTLIDQGVSDEERSRIICARVEEGRYDSKCSRGLAN